MDNFSCSHRCTSFVHFGQGRVSVCALARSARSFCRSLTLLATALTPIMFGLVRPNLRNIRVVPKSNLHPSERLSGRCLNPILSNPAMKSTRSNSKQPGYLNRRIRLHEYNGVPCIICQGKSVPRRARFLVRQSGLQENNSVLSVVVARWWNISVRISGTCTRDRVVLLRRHSFVLRFVTRNDGIDPSSSLWFHFTVVTAPFVSETSSLTVIHFMRVATHGPI
jgi:hypothetical protein